MELDDSDQKRIIELSGTTSLILAGPGCGKTHILARRVVYASADVDFSRMLCVTFTNRAAREMKARIENYLGYMPADLFVGNMHRFCLKFLYDNHILRADTSVLDEEDQMDYLKTILDNPRQEDITDFLTKAAYIYQKDHDHPDEIIRHPARDFCENDYKAIDEYIRFKATNRLVDFDDLLLQTYSVLMQQPAKDYLMTNYEWVQVDEVQDMTPLQLAIVDAITKRINRTVVYFGDEQQAIFRFLGAGGRALDRLKHQCKNNILRLHRNYRSPGYLVEMCNRLAANWLDIDYSLLPRAVNNCVDAHNLTLYQGDAEELAFTAANICRHRLAESKDESIAVLCRTNLEADNISELFTSLGLKHFHVSKQDLFHQLPFKTVWSHLAAVAQPSLIQPWARLLYQLKCVTSLNGARNLVRLLNDSAIRCDELLSFDKPFIIEIFAAIYNSDNDIVVFDTETTGLDVTVDDVVQIAAVKLRHGKIIDRFEVFIVSDKPLPQELEPGVANPLIDIYTSADKLSPAKAFELFAAFIKDAIPAGHNIDFDKRILKNNYDRLQQSSYPFEQSDLKNEIDTLTISTLLYPKASSHKLGDLIDMLNIEARNSHNAADDVDATVKLLKVLAKAACDRLPLINKVRQNINICRCAEKFAARYGLFYAQWRSRLCMKDCVDNSLADAIRAADNFMSRNGYTLPVEKLDYVTALVDGFIVDNDVTPDFGTQVSRHLFDLLSFNESDLYSNCIVKERLSVMTVHKAKGLEMDNVVVYNASKFYGKVEDHARLLYVAFSRARKRLAVGVCGSMPMPMRGIHHYFHRLTPNQVRIAVNCEYLNRK